MTIEFSVETTPFAQPRPRVVRGHAFEPKRISEYKDAIRTIARVHMRGRTPFQGLVVVRISIRRNVKLGSKNFGDIDNHIKAILDALNGVCYADDALIVELHSVKEHSSDEGVDISVSDSL